MSTASTGTETSLVLSCSDSDAAVRELLARFPEARDIEIRGAQLEEAFLQLTADPHDGESPTDQPLEVAT